VLDGYDLIYETYGTLNADKTNAILVATRCLAPIMLPVFIQGRRNTPAGGQHDRPRQADRHERFFVVGLNNLGGCHGSTGPSSIDPKTGRPYGAAFPIVTVEDWVESQARLADRLGIETFAAIMGGSLGGIRCCPGASCIRSACAMPW